MSGWALDYDGDLALAAEYVLGLLPPDELAHVEDRLTMDQAFRDLVARWSEDLARLTDDIPAVAPPPAVEKKLLKELFSEPQASRGWRLWPLLLAGAVAAGVATLALNPALVGIEEPEYQARIMAEDGSLIVEALYDVDTRRLAVSRLVGAAPDGRDLELWLVQSADGATTSLGVLPHDEDGVLVVRGDLAAQFVGNALALSVEPLGGSPTGQATGPVVAVGAITGL